MACVVLHDRGDVRLRTSTETRLLPVVFEYGNEYIFGKVYCPARGHPLLRVRSEPSKSERSRVEHTVFRASYVTRNVGVAQAASGQA